MGSSRNTVSVGEIVVVELGSRGGAVVVVDGESAWIVGGDTVVVGCTGRVDDVPVSLVVVAPPVHDAAISTVATVAAIRWRTSAGLDDSGGCRGLVGLARHPATFRLVHSREERDPDDEEHDEAEHGRSR